MSELTVAEVMDRAADLIEPEGAWTQGAFARNAVGEETGLSGYRGKAVCWCLLGATDAVTPWTHMDVGAQADRFFAEFLGSVAADGLGIWNDAPERTQAEVVARLREAAQLAREQGK